MIRGDIKSWPKPFLVRKWPVYEGKEEEMAMFVPRILHSHWHINLFRYVNITYSTESIIVLSRQQLSHMLIRIGWHKVAVCKSRF